MADPRPDDKELIKKIISHIKHTEDIYAKKKKRKGYLNLRA